MAKFPAYQVVVMLECFTKTISADGLELTNSTSEPASPNMKKFKELAGKISLENIKEIIDQSIKKTYGYFLLKIKSYKITKKRNIFDQFHFLLIYSVDP